jgi:hypothetical protein
MLFTFSSNYFLLFLFISSLFFSAMLGVMRMKSYLLLILLCSRSTLNLAFCSLSFSFSFNISLYFLECSLISSLLRTMPYFFSSKIRYLYCFIFSSNSLNLSSISLYLGDLTSLLRKEVSMMNSWRCCLLLSSVFNRFRSASLRRVASSSFSNSYFFLIYSSSSFCFLY